MKFSSSDVAFGECNFILLAKLSLDVDFDIVVKSSSKELYDFQILLHDKY